LVDLRVQHNLGHWYRLSAMPSGSELALRVVQLDADDVQWPMRWRAESPPPDAGASSADEWIRHPLGSASSLSVHLDRVFGGR
jgi:hypothetical protein